jgi:hypothetical protein
LSPRKWGRTRSVLAIDVRDERRKSTAAEQAPLYKSNGIAAGRRSHNGNEQKRAGQDPHLQKSNGIAAGRRSHNGDEQARAGQDPHLQKATTSRRDAAPKSQIHIK